MYRSPSTLPEASRQKIADSLNARLADGLDLHSQIKVAHWNIKGPQFAALHPLFETFAIALAGFNNVKPPPLPQRSCLGGSISALCLGLLDLQKANRPATAASERKSRMDFIVV